MKPHEWKVVYDGSYANVFQCGCCEMVKVIQFAGDIAYYHRGERQESDRDFDDEGCYGDLPPMPLEKIIQGHESYDRARLLWLILHYNAPITHVVTIMQGLLKLCPIDTELVRQAHEHNMRAGRALLAEIFKRAES